MGCDLAQPRCFGRRFDCCSELWYICSAVDRCQLKCVVFIREAYLWPHYQHSVRLERQARDLVVWGRLPGRLRGRLKECGRFRGHQRSRSAFDSSQVAGRSTTRRSSGFECSAYAAQHASRNWGMRCWGVAGAALEPSPVIVVDTPLERVRRQILLVISAKNWPKNLLDRPRK